MKNKGQFYMLMRGAERRILFDAMTASGGNKSRAARTLGISRKTFHAKLAAKELDSEDYPLAFAVVRDADSARCIALWTEEDVAKAVSDAHAIMTTMGPGKEGSPLKGIDARLRDKLVRDVNTALATGVRMMMA